LLGNNVGVEAHRAALADQGFVYISGGFETVEEAFGEAWALVDPLAPANAFAPLSVIGDFVIPPLDTAETRDFQTLHFDFGLPIDPKMSRDLALYTALHVSHGAPPTSALTRLVPIAGLLRQREWPTRGQLLSRLVSYGKTHGAWDDAEGYQEGSFARIIEAAAGNTPRLPSVKADPGFLCGMEFDSLQAEVAFLRDFGLRVDDVQVAVVVRPGDLLVFDNLRLAHGRSGKRQPGELRQRVFGYKDLSPASQLELRDCILGAFDAPYNGAVQLSAP
jgi:hypothetical protein